MSLGLKWAGTGAMPFVGVQVSPSESPTWIVGGAGYSDSWGPVQEVSSSVSGWQEFAKTVTLASEVTAVRFSVELFAGVVYPGANGAAFDGFSLVSGACP